LVGQIGFKSAVQGLAFTVHTKLRKTSPIKWFIESPAAVGHTRDNRCNHMQLKDFITLILFDFFARLLIVLVNEAFRPSI